MTTTELHPLRRAVDDGPMTGFQWRVIAVCVVLNMLDGFDVLVMSFTARPVGVEWQLSASAVGLLLSAGLVGLAVGSLFLAPRADRFGRRPVIMAGLVIAGLGMLASSLAQSALQLGLLRLLTGMGVGAILASSNVLASEYASRRWRGMAVSLQGTGYAIGATAGGLLAVNLIQTNGWRVVFLTGGVLTLAALVLVYLCQPESLDHLLAHRRADSLAKVNALARKLGQPEHAELPAQAGASTPGRVGLLATLSPENRRSTILLWACFALVMAGFYFVTSWTPTLLVDAGLSASSGITGGVLLNVGGMFGAVALGVLSTRFPVRAVVVGYLVLGAVMLTLFIGSAQNIVLLLCVAAAIGLFLNGSIGGLYAITPSAYDASVRATGMGAAIGIGRLGAILAPVAAGGLLDGGWTPQSLYVAVAVLLVVAAGLLTLLRTSARLPAATAPTGADQLTRTDG